MLAGVSPASKHKLRLVIQIRLEIHESSYPLKNKPALKEMAAAPIEEGNEGSSSPNLGKRVFGDLRVETYGKSSTDKSVGPLAFSAGISGMESVKGLIHIYKDRSASGSPLQQPLLCMLAIPSSLRCADLLNFIAPSCQHIQRVQIIRDASPNHYMALLYFKSAVSTVEFYKTYHGTPYSSLEKQRCCVLVYVSKVETVSSSQGASFPPSGCSELPNCPVCLERMDESIITSTILTALCNHSFHAECLTRWEDNTCPVCRHVQTPELVEDNRCTECGETEHLWICVVCGYVGCGRYTGGHAHNHFLKTQHTYTMELGSQRVWDYAGDNYVHRLVQTKAGGKMVEVSGSGEALPNDEKLDSLQLEYTYLLTSQLESQRHYFEGKVAQIETEAQEQLSLMEERLKATALECEKLQSLSNELRSEKKAVEKKNQQLVSRVQTLESDLKEEKELNKCMSDNQRLWRERVEMMEKKMDLTIKQKDLEVKELQEQVRDVMFYLDTQKKVDDSTEKQELQEGHVIISQSNPSVASSSGGGGTSASGSGKKSRKKKKN